MANEYDAYADYGNEHFYECPEYDESEDLPVPPCRCDDIMNSLDKAMQDAQDEGLV